jgi:hypothetical protein
MAGRHAVSCDGIGKGVRAARFTRGSRNGAPVLEVGAELNRGQLGKAVYSLFKSFDGLRPIVFGPRTLSRTWGEPYGVVAPAAGLRRRPAGSPD